MTPVSLFLALKYLKPKRSVLSVVTLISVIGVLLGVAILIIVLSVMTGFDNMWKEKILSFRPHLTVESRYGLLENEDELCDRLEKVRGVVSASPVIETLALVEHDGKESPPYVIGIDPDRLGIMERVRTNMCSGVFSLEDYGAVIGIDEARKLDLHVGDKLLIYSEVIMQGMSKDEMYLPEEVTIRGIFNLGMQKFDEGFVITSLEVAREIVGLEEGSRRIYVMTDDPERFVEYGQRVQDTMGYKYIVRTWNEIDRVLFEALKVEKTMMFILLGFITIVAIFCVTNTLIVVTVQKTSEIGILRAIGYSPRQIRSAFVWHGWIQCLVGTAAGIGLGVLVLHNMQNIVALLAKMHITVFPKQIYGLDKIPYEIKWFPDVTMVAVTVMVFCTLASLIPASRAARLDPVEALRQE